MHKTTRYISMLHSSDKATLNRKTGRIATFCMPLLCDLVMFTWHTANIIAGVIDFYRIALRQLLNFCDLKINIFAYS